MFNKKFIGFFIILSILIVSIGIVSANENISQISLTETNLQTNAEKTFDDIQNEINIAKENDTIELDGKYISSGEYIKISKSLTLQGKTENTILNGNNSSGIFQITSDNVNLNLKNLKIINSKTEPAIIKHKDYENNLEYSAIYGKYSSTINIFNSSFENNNGQLIAHGTYTCTNTNFLNNTHLKYIEGHINNYLIDAEGFESYNCSFINNFVKDELIRSNEFCKIYDCYLINNNIGKKYMPILVIGTGSENIISNSRFMNNNAYPAFLVGYYNLINNSLFINNSKGISLKGDSKIINSKFEYNGGGVLLDVYRDDWEPWYTYRANSEILNCTFNSNIEKFGAILACTNLKVVDCSFTNNFGEFAGAITIREGDEQTYIDYAEIINCTFENNKQSSIVTTDIHAKINITNGNMTKKFGSNVILNDSLNSMQLINVTTSKVNTVFNSGEKLKIELINNYTKNPVQNSKITLKIYSGSKYKNFYAITNSKGIATFQASTLNVGSYKVEIISNHGICSIPKTTTSIKITKAKTIINAQKITAKYKKTKYFRVTIKHKTTKKPVQKTYVKIKIDKKTYKVKTNSKGIAKLNTKKLKIGKHKVIITSGNSNYKMSGKSTIIIKR